MASHSHPSNGRIRVVICDDAAALRGLMRATLEAEPDLEVVGEAGDGRTCLDVVAAHKPDVVLLDLAMPGIDGLEALPEICLRSPHSAIVVFSGFSASRMRKPALDLGAVGYVEKGEALEHLALAVREAADRRAS